MSLRRLLRLTLLVLPLLISNLYLAHPVAAAAVNHSVQPYARQQGNTATVRAVLFWMEGCSHCHVVREQILPPLQARYGSKLEIIEIEVKDAATADRLYRAAAALGFQPDRVGVPFLIIGDRALIGAVQIPRELPGLIEKHLVAGGVDVPPLPGLEGLAATGAQPAAGMLRSGFGFAWAVMIILIISVVYAGLTTAVEFRGGQVATGPAWLSWATPALCLVGLVVAVYLSYVEMMATPAVCGPVGDCNTVQSSAYARLFGVLPVAVLGACGYLAILAAWVWARLRTDTLAAYAPVAIFAMTLFGVLFFIYLTYLELFVIHAVCAWCLVAAVVMGLLLVVNVGPALAALRTSDEPD